MFAEAQMDEPWTGPFAAGTALVLSARCPGVERENQDGAAVIPLDEHSGLLVVADGLGGLPAGARAARIALDSLVSAVETARQGNGHLRAAVLDGLERANREIQELRVGAGTTVAAVAIRDGAARPFHVGDSAILITGQRGRVKLMTVAHSPVGYGLEAGLIDEHEAMEHQDRHLLSNLVGAPDMRIEMGPELALRSRDTVLLASDGLFDNLHIHEIVGTIRKGSLERAARSLAATASLRMRGGEPGSPQKPDDLTFVLYRRGN